MEYTAAAKMQFDKLVQEADPWHCAAAQGEHGVRVDGGWACPGGWMAAKCVLEGLMGGRGQVSYAHRKLPDGRQVPAVEVFCDDPAALAAAFRPDKRGIYGVREGEDYVLGVSSAPAEEFAQVRGNLVCAPADSLLTCVLAAGSLLARGVDALEQAGVEDIQWGWSSCPIPPMACSADAGLTQSEGAVSIWVRGEGEAIRRAVGANPVDGFCVHELKTAYTYRKAEKEWKSEIF